MKQLANIRERRRQPGCWPAHAKRRLVYGYYGMPVGRAVGFGQKGRNFFGQPDPPPRDTLSSPQTPYTPVLRAFGATRVCHMADTGGPLLAEKVVPSETVADSWATISRKHTVIFVRCHGLRLRPDFLSSSFTVSTFTLCLVCRRLSYFHPTHYIVVSKLK